MHFNQDANANELLMHVLNVTLACLNSEGMSGPIHQALGGISKINLCPGNNSIPKTYPWVSAIQQHIKSKYENLYAKNNSLGTNVARHTKIRD